MDFSFSDNLNFNSVEDLLGLSARAIFKINSSSVFKEDIDIVPTVVEYKLSYNPVGVHQADYRHIKGSEVQKHTPIK